MKDKSEKAKFKVHVNIVDQKNKWIYQLGSLVHNNLIWGSE